MKHHYRASCWALAAALGHMLAVCSLAATTQPATQPAAIPDDAAQTKARAVVAEAYRKELAAARTEPAKAALARKMLQSAIETANDSAGRFILFQRARELAVEGLDLDTALTAVSEAQRYYQLDGITFKTKLLTDASRKAHTATEMVPILDHVNDVIEECVAADRFSDAMTLAKLGISVSSRLNSPRATKEARQRLDEIGQISAAFAAVAREQENLPATEPATSEPPTTPATQATIAQPAASEQMAKYVCFVKGDWKAGLALLALLPDAALGKVAQTELDGPDTPDAQLALADTWWDISLAEQGISRNRIQAHAASWYSKAVTTLSGLARARAETRIKAAEGVTPLVGATTTQSAKSRAVVYRFATIPSSEQWIKIDFPVVENEYYEVSAKGTWSDVTGKSCGPAGASQAHFISALGAPAEIPDAQRESFCFGKFPKGALIGRFNEDEWRFFCGEHVRFCAPRSGTISFRINDPELMSDKRSGAMNLLIRHIAPPALVDPDGTVTISALVDGHDVLHLTPDGIYWEYGGENRHVGRWQGTYPTLINGVCWWPNWEKNDHSDMLATGDLWPAHVEQFKLLSVEAHRGRVLLVASNRTEIRLEFRNRSPGANHDTCMLFVGKR